MYGLQKRTRLTTGRKSVVSLVVLGDGGWPSAARWQQELCYQWGQDTITPIYRDTSYHDTEHGTELRRQMIVGGRTFFVRSIFSAAEKAKTPTEQMLQIIDSDLGKDSI